MLSSARAKHSFAIREGSIGAFVVTSADLLSLFDLTGLLFAGWLTSWFSSLWSTPAESLGIDSGLHYLVVTAGLMAAIMLYDRQFGERARRGDWSALVRCYLTRLLFFTGGVLVVGAASGVLDTTFPRAVVVWLTLSFVLTSSVRGALASSIRLLALSGALTEIVAIVGAGSLADRLNRDSANGNQASMRVIGVFDDADKGNSNSARSGDHALAGTVDDLIELGKTRRLDWIFVNLQTADEQKLTSIVRRLKALAVPIALCPWNVGQGTPYQRIDYVGGVLPVTVLVDRRAQRGRAAVQAACQFLPRWIATLLLLPMSLTAILRPRSQPAQRSAGARETQAPL